MASLLSQRPYLLDLAYHMTFLSSQDFQKKSELSPVPTAEFENGS